MKKLFLLLSICSLFSQTSPTVRVDSLSALQSLLIPKVSTKFSAIVGGALTNGDQLGGVFVWNAIATDSTNGANQNKVIASPYGATIGRWIIADGSRLGAGPTNMITGNLLDGNIPQAANSTNLVTGPMNVSAGTNVTSPGILSANGGIFTNSLTINGNSVPTTNNFEVTQFTISSTPHISILNGGYLTNMNMTGTTVFPATTGIAQWLYNSNMHLNRAGASYNGSGYVFDNLVTDSGAGRYAILVDGMEKMRVDTGTFWWISSLANVAGLYYSASGDKLELGKSHTATNDTTGFVYLNSVPGIPTGVPITANDTTKIPIVFDSLNKNLYFYSGSWILVGGAGTSGAPTNTIVGNLTANRMPVAFNSTNVIDGPFTVSGTTNALLPGNLFANGGIFTNSLTLNGVPVSTNSTPGTPTNAFESTQFTVTSTPKVSISSGATLTNITMAGTTIYPSSTGISQWQYNSNEHMNRVGASYNGSQYILDNLVTDSGTGRYGQLVDSVERTRLDGTGWLIISSLANAPGFMYVVTGDKLELGKSHSATTDTGGYIYFNSVAGVPTGVPVTATDTSKMAFVVDRSNTNLYLYGNRWLKFVPAADLSANTIAAMNPSGNGLTNSPLSINLGTNVVVPGNLYSSGVIITNNSSTTTYDLSTAGNVFTKYSTTSTGLLNTNDFSLLTKDTGNYTGNTPANWWKLGRQIHFRGQGSYKTTVAPGHVNFVVKWGGSSIGVGISGGQSLPDNSATNSPMVVDFTMQCSSAGAGGRIEARGTVTLGVIGDPTKTYLYYIQPAFVSIDTTVAGTMDFTINLEQTSNEFKLESGFADWKN